MKPSEKIEAIKSLISDPARWTQHVAARDAQGLETHATDENAVCWCVYGAGAKLRFPVLSFYTYIEEAARDMVGIGGVSMNDSLPHDKVMSVLDHAIKLAKGKGA